MNPRVDNASLRALKAVTLSPHFDESVQLLLMGCRVRVPNTMYDNRIICVRNRPCTGVPLPRKIDTRYLVYEQTGKTGQGTQWVPEVYICIFPVSGVLRYLVYGIQQ